MNKMPNQADTDLKGWFSMKGLPWNAQVITKLVDDGIECVEDLKLLPFDQFIDLISLSGPPRYIMKAKAKMSFLEL